MDSVPRDVVPGRRFEHADRRVTFFTRLPDTRLGRRCAQGFSYPREDTSQTSRAPLHLASLRLASSRPVSLLSSEMLRLTSILDLKALCTDLKTTRGSSKGLARRQTLSVVRCEQHMPRHSRLENAPKKQCRRAAFNGVFHSSRPNTFRSDDRLTRSPAIRDRV